MFLLYFINNHLLTDNIINGVNQRYFINEMKTSKYVKHADF